jgi:hypothetical protein
MRPENSLRPETEQANFRYLTLLWHNGRLSALRLRLLGGHTREAKPDPGILPESLNCSVTPTGEVA